MPASPTESREEQAASAIEDQINHENGAALDWEEIEIDIGWGTVRGKAIGNGPHHMLGEYDPIIGEDISVNFFCFPDL